MVPPCSNRISRVPPYSRTKCLSTRTGLSPTMVRLSRRFRFLTNCHWPGPRSLATTNGVSVDVLSSGYLDVSVPRVGLLNLCIQFKIPLRVGFPIRKSSDQSLFATPRSLSQRTTSFIASQRQGIHRMPLSHLITLIIDAHPTLSRETDYFRKDQLIRVLPDRRRFKKTTASSCNGPLAGPRTNLLFTMSDNTRTTEAVANSLYADAGIDRMSMPTMLRCVCQSEDNQTNGKTKQDLVEPDGIEPTTSCLQSRRSPN